MLNKEKLLKEIQSEIRALEHVVEDEQKDILNLDTQKVIKIERLKAKIEILKDYEKEIFDGEYDE